MPWSAHPINYAFVLSFIVMCCGLLLVTLTHISLENLAGKLQTTFSNTFYSIKNVWTSIKISQKFVPKGPIDNESTLVQVMAWRRQATSHYLSQCWTSSPTDICGTRGRWVNVTLTNMSNTSGESIIRMLAWQSCPAPRVRMAAQLSITSVMSGDESMHRLNVTCDSYKLTQKMYCQTSYISGTKSRHLNVSRLVLQLSLPSPLKTDVRSRMKM